MSHFAEGIQVIYRDHVGMIAFTCDTYLSICVYQGRDKAHDVRVVVYRSDWPKIQLYKESGK